MANPRKFSDKIALHTQKQAEETAAFEAILREVSASTKVSSEKSGSQQLQRPAQPPVQQPIQQQHHLQLVQPNFGAYRGQSLPNVNKVANNSIDLQSALSSLEDMRQAVSGGHAPHPEKQHRDRGQQPQKKFSVDRHRDCSPYGSVSYLSPPPDTSWRRASSDSALHATVQGGGGGANLSGSGVIMTNGQNDGSLLQVGHVTGMETGQLWDLRGVRPRSCEVPGINIYPSPDLNSTTTSILISNNTGSLPDLANLNFPSPLLSPLDAEGASNQQCLSQDSGILENYVSPTMSIALQLYQQQLSKQQQQQGLPMASAGIQRHMVPAPLVLHGSNSFLMGGNTVLAQDNIYPSLSCKSFSDSRSPPPYSSFTPVKSSPLSPPLITLTDVTQSGHEEKILFSEFERENGWHQTNGWSNHLQMPFQKSSHGSEVPMDYVSTPLSPSNSLAHQTRRHTKGKSSTKNVNRCVQSAANSSTCKLEDGNAEMKNGDLTTNCERIKVEDIKADVEGLSMAQYRAGSSDAPQSPVSPLSQPSSSYSPSQSPGTSASMASSPQMVDVSYQPDISTSQQLQQHYTNITSQLGQQQQQQQQLTRLVQKPLMQSPAVENLPQKFRQIKVADNGTAPSDLGLSVQQQMQHHQLQQHLQQQQLLNQQQQQQQQQVALMSSSGNVVFMQTVLDHPPPILISSIAPNSFYQQQQQPMTLQSIVSQQQQPQQQTQQQFQNPYFSCQNVVSSPEQQPVQYLPSAQQSPASSTIPDIVLTAADLSLYANQAIMDIKNTGHDLVMTSQQTDMLSRENVNLLSYLGDSFDSDMLTTDDFLKLGLDPLELEEIRMLSDANMVVTDPATEDSFRLDRM